MLKWMRGKKFNALLFHVAANFNSIEYECVTGAFIIAYISFASLCIDLTSSTESTKCCLVTQTIIVAS